MTGRAVWLTGIPASGKTTTARALVAALRERGEVALHLDSDDLREHVLSTLGYDAADRARFYAALVHLARLGVEGGATVVISATAPRRAHRDALREQVADVLEVFVDCPPAVARRRDPKGLYAAAAAGDAPDLPGAGAPYEPPAAPDVTVDATVPPEEQVRAILATLLRPKYEK